MTIQAATVLDSAATTLLDVAHRTWPADELLDYLNEGMRATAVARPTDFYVVENAVTLAVGVIQNVPADGITLIDIPRNTGGRVITQVDKGLLDEADRFWPAATKETVVEHFTFDPRNPRRFVAFPPNDGTGIVDMVYGAFPPQVMYPEEDLPVIDSYQSPLINFVLAKAYSKNSKRQDLTKTTAYMQMWGQQLGLDAQSIAATESKVASSPGTT